MRQSRPTILQIIPKLDTGGAELAVVEISDAIVRAGGRAVVIAEAGRLVPDVLKAGAEIVELKVASKNPARILANAVAIARIVEREGIDLIHARSRAPAWSALIAARKTKRPFVTTYHGAYSEHGRIKNFYNGVMARSDIVIANSRYTADLIRSRYRTPDARLRIIYRGLDRDKYGAGGDIDARARRLREHWHVDAGQRIVLQAARLTGWKGQMVLIAAVAELVQARQFDGCVAILAGDAQGRDGYVDTLEAAITGAGLSHCVRLVGHVQDIAAAYRAAHVTVVASTGPEAFGRAGAEAQAVGSPVISTNIGAPPETVRAEPAVARGERTGWLVPPADAGRLAAAIAEALALSPAEREAIGQRASRHALTTFTLDAMQRQTLAVYDGLLGTDMATALPPG